MNTNRFVVVLRLLTREVEGILMRQRDHGIKEQIKTPPELF